MSVWLFAGSAVAQGPTSAPITPPGYDIGQGVPVVASSAPVAGPRIELREHDESLRSVWIPGLIGLPLAWILTWLPATASSSPEGDATEFSWIPLVGPFLMLGQPLNGGEAYYASAGAFQIASALALIIGLSVRRTVREQVWVAGGVELDVGVGLGGGAAAIHF